MPTLHPETFPETRAEPAKPCARLAALFQSARSAHNSGAALKPGSTAPDKKRCGSGKEVSPPPATSICPRTSRSSNLTDPSWNRPRAASLSDPAPENCTGLDVSSSVQTDSLSSGCIPPTSWPGLSGGHARFLSPTGGLPRASPIATWLGTLKVHHFAPPAWYRIRRGQSGTGQDDPVSAGHCLRSSGASWSLGCRQSGSTRICEPSMGLPASTKV